MLPPITANTWHEVEQTLTPPLPPGRPHWRTSLLTRFPTTTEDEIIVTGVESSFTFSGTQLRYMVPDTHTGSYRSSHWFESMDLADFRHSST